MNEFDYLVDTLIKVRRGLKRKGATITNTDVYMNEVHIEYALEKLHFKLIILLRRPK